MNVYGYQQMNYVPNYNVPHGPPISTDELLNLSLFHKKQADQQQQTASYANQQMNNGLNVTLNTTQAPSSW